MTKIAKTDVWKNTVVGNLTYPFYIIGPHYIIGRWKETRNLTNWCNPLLEIRGYRTTITVCRQFMINKIQEVHSWKWKFRPQPHGNVLWFSLMRLGFVSGSSAKHEIRNKNTPVQSFKRLRFRCFNISWLVLWTRKHFLNS